MDANIIVLYTDPEKTKVGAPLTNASVVTYDDTTVKDALDKLNAALLTVTSYTIAKASWSNTTTTISGNAYYTYSIRVNKVASRRPTVTIGSIGTLPQTAELLAYEKLSYVVADPDMLTLVLYAEERPENDFVIDVQGVA